MPKAIFKFLNFKQISPKVWKHLEELHVAPVYYTVPWVSQLLSSSQICLTSNVGLIRWLTLMLTQDADAESALPCRFCVPTVMIPCY